MIDRERIGKKKIIHINLAYDFNLYSRPEKTEVQKIREMNSAQVVMISIGRFNSYKRVDLAVQVLKIIIENGVDARLILLGEGPERGKIEMLIRDYALQSKVIMPGYVPNIIDYLAASDFLLHPSVSESSCVVVKEAAIVGVPVIVCEKVGDFDEYIVNEANGFVISQANFAQEAAEIILSKFAQKEALGSVTATLRKDVMKLFSLESVLPQYEMLNNRAE
jgi:glycosyltransferase involved in cell wall biosynthesis